MPETLTLEQIAESQLALLDAAEKEIFQVALSMNFHRRDNTPAVVTEFTVLGFFSDHARLLFGMLGWDKRRVCRECARIQHVIMAQAKAGTKKDREKAAKAADAAAKELDERDDQLEAIIAKAKTELAALTAKRDQTADIVNRQNQNVIALRKAAPEHIRDQYEARRREIYRHYQAMIDDHPENREVLQQERAEDIAEVEKLLDVYVK